MTHTLSLKPKSHHSFHWPILFYGISFYILMQLPSLRTVFKYLAPHSLSLLIFYFIVSGLLHYGIFHYLRTRKIYSTPLSPDLAESSWFRHIDKLANSKWFSIFCFLLITLASYKLYHYELYLQALGRGSDSSNALIIAGLNLLHGQFPYKDLTYFHNPISPGPGWVILLMPLTITHLYFLVTPLCLLLAFAGIVRVSQQWRAANLFLFILMSSPFFWELLGSGIDLLALGCCFVFITSWVYSSYRQGGVGFWLSACFMGMLVTARVVLVYQAPLLAYFIFRRNKRRGLYFGLLSSALAIGLNLGFYLWQPQHYSPLHLLGKGNGLLPFDLKIAAGLACAVSAYYLLSARYQQASQWYFGAWLALFTPLVFVAFGDLIVRRQGDFSLWEGANYLAISLPLLIASLSLKASESSASKALDHSSASQYGAS